jgi:hypothetical protein
MLMRSDDRGHRHHAQTPTNILDQYSHMNAVVPPRTPTLAWTGPRPDPLDSLATVPRATVHGRRYTGDVSRSRELSPFGSWLGTLRGHPDAAAISHGTSAAAGARHLDRVAERHVLPLFARTPHASGAETGGGRLDSLARDGCARVMVIHVSDLVVDVHKGALDFLEPLELMLRATIRRALRRTRRYSRGNQRGHQWRSSVASSWAIREAIRGHQSASSPAA